VLSHIPKLDLDIKIVKLNIQEDHVHRVIMIPLKHAVARWVQYLKTQSAKALETKSPFCNRFI